MTGWKQLTSVITRRVRSRKGLRELTALAGVALVLIGLPLAIWTYQAEVVEGHYPEDAVVLTLYGSATEGVWSPERVAGWNYWWKDFDRQENLKVPAGRPIVVRVTSTDVLHSFAMPTERAYRRPMDVEAGKWVTATLEARASGEVIPFLCWQYCSPNHASMHGELLVEDAPSSPVTEHASMGSPEHEDH